MKTYTALFTADWQLCNSLPYSKPSSKEEGVTDRLIDQINVVGEIAKIARANHVQGIFFLGDLFEKRLLDAITLRYGTSLILELAKEFRVFILPGNHDANSVTGKRFTPEVFEVMKLSNVVYMDGTSVVTPVEGLDFFPVPWGPLEAALEHIDRMRANRKKGNRHVLLLHHPILECTDGGWKCDVGLDPQAVCQGWHHVYAGHFHERQDFGPCGKYVGAPMEHDQRDAGSAPRGVIVATFDKSGTVEAFHPISSPTFHTFEWDDVKDAEQIAYPGDYVRIGVTATHAEWIVRYAVVEGKAREWRAAGIHIDPFHRPVYQNEKRLDLSEGTSQDEVLRRYVELADTEGLDEKKLLEIGRSILAEVCDG